MPLVWSIVVVYAFVALIGAFAITLIAPPLGNDITSFVHAVPGLVTQFQQELISPTNALVARIPEGDRLYLAALPSQLDSLAQRYGLNTLQKSLAGDSVGRSLFAALVIVPVLAAYMLLDASERAPPNPRPLPGAAPREGRPPSSTSSTRSSGGFIRGQLIDGAIVGADDLRDARSHARAVRAADRRSRPAFSISSRTRAR